MERQDFGSITFHPFARTWRSSESLRQPKSPAVPNSTQECVWYTEVALHRIGRKGQKALCPCPLNSDRDQEMNVWGPRAAARPQKYSLLPWRKGPWGIGVRSGDQGLTAKNLQIPRKAPVPDFMLLQVGVAYPGPWCRRSPRQIHHSVPALLYYKINITESLEKNKTYQKYHTLGK